ncbi:LLM class flavin-dependent oxidoreductase [Candidatus Saccharibacteria bacterium]|nr:LLM class flavin-dependent oxidoreductase [Candidatus Saccharibacteria bacterium]MBQ68752.1 LLM class flavin-dependent oxidoreductase [Candidatus Saccharibacteria bacterium]
MKQHNILFGLDTFGDIPTDEKGKLFSYAEAIRQVVDEAVMADSLGVDIIGVGEHHRPDYAISSPETVLAGIATRTKNITLASAVTVLSSDDPVRVYQRFATIDALSNGRAQVILGRGSFTESFPLFGYDLKNYEQLFEEKVGLFSELIKEKPVTWQGETRPALDKADVFPKTDAGLDVAIGVGGSPESVIRTARYGFKLVLAIIGGSPARFAPYIDLYRQAVKEMGTTEHPVGVHSPGFIADTDEEALRLAWKGFKFMWDAVGKTRGWPPYTREQFEYEVAHGSLYVGSPETVAQKIAQTIRTLDIGRFDLVYGGGHLPASARLHMVKLYGEQVIPRVKELLSEQPHD